jgi:hypothetical protein
MADKADPKKYTPPAPTPEEKYARKKALEAWYASTAYGGGMGGKPPKELMEKWMANPTFQWDWALKWIRENDENYTKTDQYKSNGKALDDMLIASLGIEGAKDYLASKEYAKVRNRLSRADPRMQFDTILANVFQNRVMKSPEFKRSNPGFIEWAEANRGVTSYYDAFQSGYVKLRDSFTTSWKDAYGLQGDVPPDILKQAIVEGWDAGGARWDAAVRNTPSYAGSQTAGDRAKDFDAQWALWMPAGVPPDEALRNGFIKSSGTLDDYFRDSVKSSSIFTTSYPEYAAWEVAQSKQGEPIGPDAFFTERNAFTEKWQELYGDVPINAALLSQALSENWSTVKWEQDIKKLPEYSGTDTAKAKGMEFDAYWRGLFGDASPVDPSLKAQYTTNNAMQDPSDLWDQIKSSSTFQSQFTNWDAFAAAQGAVGQNVSGDPMAYNQYKAAFYKAFADIGMSVPDGMDREIFASGVSTGDIQNNAETYAENKDSYQWQTGQQADLRTAIGIGNAAAGGDLRIRLRQALEQHKAYTSSKYNTARSNTQQVSRGNDLVTQKI